MKLYHVFPRERLEDVRQNGLVFRNDPSEIFWVFDYYADGTHSLKRVRMGVFFESEDDARAFGSVFYDDYLIAECDISDDELPERSSRDYYCLVKGVVEPREILRMFS